VLTSDSAPTSPLIQHLYLDIFMSSLPTSDSALLSSFLSALIQLYLDTFPGSPAHI
jgi:hypothetical protein